VFIAGDHPLSDGERDLVFRTQARQLSSDADGEARDTSASTCPRAITASRERKLLSNGRRS